MSCIMCHCVTNVIAVEHQVLNVWWAVLLRSDCSSIGLHFITQTRWTASLIFLSSPPPKPMYDMIVPDSRLVPMYDTILPDSRLVPMCDTILSRFLYNINLGAMHTTILGIRGVTISIYLVSSATDSIRWSVVLFKPVSVPTSDPKSEFLCQSSLLLRRTYRPPWTPRTPGISPTPSSPHITHTVTALVRWPSTWSRGSTTRELSVLVAARPLKLSRAFHSNVTSATATALA